MPDEDVFPLGHATMPHTTTSLCNPQVSPWCCGPHDSSSLLFSHRLYALLQSCLFRCSCYWGYAVRFAVFSESEPRKSANRRCSFDAAFIAPQRPTTSPPVRPVQLPISNAPSTNRPAGFGTFDLSASQPIDFNLRTTVEETVSRFSAIAQEKGVELSCLFSSDSPTPFRGDPGDLRLILMNLIDYALSSITLGEVVVRGTLQQQTATHATFRFSVSSLSLIPLTSVTSSVANNNVTPLLLSREEAGIAISKQLVKSFGGQLDVENSPDLSTTIWFTLTLEKQPPKVFSDLPPRTSLTGTRLLLVGNDFLLSNEDVCAWGLTSQQVPHSSPILSILNTAVQNGQPYDVVLFNYQQLGVDVLDLASRVRATAALAMLRLVFLTNRGKKGDAHRVRQAGFDAYLTQPVSSALLFECLATVLGQPPQVSAPHLPLVTRYTLAEARTRGRSRILVVDSSLPDQKHAVRLIEELGYRVDIATTAREAIEANSRLPYAAVLLPIHMPGIDGIAAALQIRQQECQEGQHTPLIGILQSQNDTEHAQCLAAGMDTVVVKPLLSTSLKVALDNYCRSSAELGMSLTGSSQREDGTIEADLHEALARVEGDKELFDEMTALFIEEYPKTLTKMHEAVTRQDTQALAYSANALKGSLGNFAATKAIDTALRLEHMGRCGDLSHARSALNDLEKQLARLQALLTDFRLHAAA